MFTSSSKYSSNRAFLIVLSIFILFIYGCESGSREVEKTASQTAPAEDKKKKVVKINVDMDTQKKLQSAADQGFKKWKNNVIDVAQECIIGKGVGAPDKCEVLSQSDAKAVVRVTTKKEGSFKVTLKRLVKPNGIWTATEIEKED